MQESARKTSLLIGINLMMFCAHIFLFHNIDNNNISYIILQEKLKNKHIGYPIMNKTI